MDTGSGSSSSSVAVNCMMMNFGGENYNNNNGGLSSMTRMMNSAQENDSNKPFLASPWSWNNNTLNYSHLGSSSAAENVNTKTHESLTKANIMAHPLFPRLLSAYANCQKVGAPPEVVARLEEACGSERAMERSRTSCVGEDPALDQFMEAYCEMLTKYEQELTKPLREAMAFISGMDCQLKALSVDSGSNSSSGQIRSSGDDIDDIDGIGSNVNPVAEDNDLKGQLLRKYSGYIGSLKQEFSKKKKKGKLPKEARQKLLDWWSRHYKWPYPSESQKLALAQSTGLDQKQINNWFINQRKRHWKPSEDVQYAVMDTIHPHIYMEGVMNNPYPMDCMPMLL